MQAKKMLENGCTRFLASAVDKNKEVKLKPEDVPTVIAYVTVCARRNCQVYLQNKKSISRSS